MWWIKNYNNKLNSDVFMHIAKPSKQTSMGELRNRVIKIQGLADEVNGYEGKAEFEGKIIDLYEDLAVFVSSLHTMLSHGTENDTFLSQTGLRRDEKVWVILICKI